MHLIKDEVSALVFWVGTGILCMLQSVFQQDTRKIFACLVSTFQTLFFCYNQEHDLRTGECSLFSLDIKRIFLKNQHDKPVDFSLKIYKQNVFF